MLRAVQQRRYSLRKEGDALVYETDETQALDGPAMTVLEDVKPGAMIRGVVPGHSGRIVSADWIGNQAVKCASGQNTRTPSGSAVCSVPKAA